MSESASKTDPERDHIKAIHFMDRLDVIALWDMSGAFPFVFFLLRA